MPVTGIKALTFDTFGTVVDWRASIISDFRTYARRRKLGSVQWEALIDEWKTCYRPGMDAVNDGGPWTTVHQIYRRKLDEILPRYGLGALGESDRQYLNRVWHRLKPWPDAVAGLKRLRKKYLLSPLSNGDVACLANMAKSAGLPWDLILCAEMFRRYKPAPEVYLGAIDYLGLQPHEVMMVAAHNYDLKHA
ncbi:MAG TPA: haloacid dehalogenase type II, partial [Burkholderiales bacterium]|nr:haloacid dehalogenase type II [Burkholderiales bacterium]